MENKRNCKTCMYEPDWDFYGKGICKRVKDSSKDEAAVLRIYYDKYARNESDGYDIVDCPVWVSKNKEKHYFDGVKVGDSVYSLNYGEGEVTEVNDGGFRVYFYNIYAMFFNMDGYRLTSNKDSNQTLFWSMPILCPPKKPKRKIKEEVRTELLLMQANDGKKYLITKNMLDDYDIPNRILSSVNIRSGEVCPEFEWEE